jgi:hypothetical protein
MEHDGVLTFITVLSAGDDALLGNTSTTNEAQDDGDWRVGLSARTAEVTPSGNALLFMSRRRLIDYDNAGMAEVYRFDAGKGRINCASCDPAGVPPSPVPEQGAGEPGRSNPEPAGGSLRTPALSGFVNGESGRYQLRQIADSGKRVFFQSYQQLVPQAPAEVESLYEWEQEGEGTCTAANSSPINGGCVFLLSGGLSTEEAVFIDADAEGQNVFFTSRARLAPEDQNEQVDVYDARVGGGFPHLESACTSTGCQGVPPAPPAFATPASTTFSGAGNFTPVASRQLTKPETRSQRLAAALKSCRKDQRKRKRVSCERRARQRYGVKRKPSKRPPQTKRKPKS